MVEGENGVVEEEGGAVGVVEAVEAEVAEVGAAMDEVGVGAVVVLDTAEVRHKTLQLS